MKKQILYMVCATALLSSCHIYKSYDRPEDITTSGLYRDPKTLLLPGCIVTRLRRMIHWFRIQPTSAICRGEKSSPTRSYSLSSKRD